MNAMEKMHRYGLSPIIEEFSNILLSSSKKRPRDDSVVAHRQLPMQDLFGRLANVDMHAQAQKQEKVTYVNAPQSQALSKLLELHERAQGPYGMLAKQLMQVRYPARQQAYSFTLLSAVSKDGVVANPIVEGGMDSGVYEHFLRRLREHVARDEKHRGKRVVLLMDNAAIHHHALVIETALHHNAVVLYNTPYSPQLNPVENYFKHLKAHIRRVAPSSRYTSSWLTPSIESSSRRRSSTSSAAPAAACSARCGPGQSPIGSRPWRCPRIATLGENDLHAEIEKKHSEHKHQGNHTKRPAWKEVRVMQHVDATMHSHIPVRATTLHTVP